MVNVGTGTSGALVNTAFLITFSEMHRLMGTFMMTNMIPTVLAVFICNCFLLLLPSSYLQDNIMHKPQIITIRSLLFSTTQSRTERQPNEVLCSS